jgi:hypothetical protein
MVHISVSVLRDIIREYNHFIGVGGGFMFPFLLGNPLLRKAF